MTINNHQDYIVAQTKLKAYFVDTSCSLDNKAASELMKSIDRWKLQVAKKTCTLEAKYTKNPEL